MVSWRTLREKNQHSIQLQNYEANRESSLFTHLSIELMFVLYYLRLIFSSIIGNIIKKCTKGETI